MQKTLRIVQVALLCLLAISSRSQTNKTEASLNYADVLISSSGVTNPNNAVDADLTNYAVMRAEIGIANSSTLSLGWSLKGTAGETAAVEFENDNGSLNADVLQSMSLALFDSNGQRIARKNGFDVSDATVVEGTSHYKIRLKPKGAVLDIASIRIQIAGFATLENRIRIYNAVLSAACANVSAGSVYAKHNVQNANNAVSPDGSDFATLVPPLLADNSYLDLSFAEPGAAGKPVNFQLGEGTAILSADLLHNITLTAYDTDGNVVKSKSGFSLADAEVLGGGRFNLSLRTPAGSYQIGRARITFVSFVNVLTTLKVYKIIAHAGGCSTPTAQEIAVDKPAYGQATEFRAYPNPFHAYTVIDLKGASRSTVHITITDKTGTIKEEYSFTGQNSVKVLQNAASGVYFIKINSNEKQETIKVIKL